MPAAIKAIVFKTTQLKSTKDFFEKGLKFQIKESSARHFVVYSKSIRLVFLESKHAFEIELYVNNKSDTDSKQMLFDSSCASFKSCKDPNGINIIIADKDHSLQK